MRKLGEYGTIASDMHSLSKLGHLHLLMLTAIIEVLLGVPSMTLACDLDGDGKTDPLAYQTQADGSWTWTGLLSGGGTYEVTQFGNSMTFPVPGYYRGPGPAVLGVVNFGDFFWTVQKPGDENGDRLNFGAANVSYMGGKDWNGDGITDLGKFLNRCSGLKKHCLRTMVTGNFLINDTDGVSTFTPNPTTATGLFGHALAALVALDADDDGDDDVCYSQSKKRRPTSFIFRCKDVRTSTTSAKFSVGRLEQRPLGMTRPNGDELLLWRKKRSTTLITLINPRTRKRSAFSIPVAPEAGEDSVLVGDWLGSGSQQIGIVSSSTLTVLDPETENLTELPSPAGRPISCDTNFNGPNESSLLTSRNACRVTRACESRSRAKAKRKN